MLSFFVGIVVSMLRMLLATFPDLSLVFAGFATALNLMMSYAMAWNWILPFTQTMSFIVLIIKFEFAITVFIATKWIVEMVRGK